MAEAAPQPYAPRQPEQSVLYRLVAEQLETLIQETKALPRFVEREFRRFLECGIAAHGFLRVRCDTCTKERIVPFSCKGRGFCPCCGGRRMAETAAHLVDRVFPRAPVRQWVLTLPWGLRYRMAFDAKLTGDILKAFVRAIFASLRRRARQRHFHGKLRGGAVTFVQRFGDALNLNVHFHTLALDGVYADEGDERRFHHLPPPSDEEVARVTAKISRWTASLAVALSRARAPQVGGTPHSVDHYSSSGFLPFALSRAHSHRSMPATPPPTATRPTMSSAQCSQERGTAQLRCSDPPNKDDSMARDHMA